LPDSNRPKWIPFRAGLVRLSTSKIFVVAEVLPAERYRSFQCQDALGGGTDDRVDIVEATNQMTSATMGRHKIPTAFSAVDRDSEIGI
jgi:hypothetical protein